MTARLEYSKNYPHSGKRPGGRSVFHTIDRIPTAPVSFQLTATPSGYVSVPAVVTLEPGLTGASFSVRATENTRIEDPVVVTFRETSERVAPSSAECTIIDDEPRVLSLELHLTTIIEGETLSGTVRIPGTLRRLRLSDEGVAWDGSLQLDGVENSSDFKVDGNLALFGSGFAIDISSGRRMDVLPSASLSVRSLAPELSHGRVFLLSEGIDRFHLRAYDVGSRFPIEMVTISGYTGRSGSLVRWGPHGLAFRTYDSVVFLNSTAIVPGAPPVDLEVHIDIDPYPVTPTDIHTHVIRVRNRGTELAQRVILEVSLEGNNRLTNIVTSQGVADAYSPVWEASGLPSYAGAK